MTAALYNHFGCQGCDGSVPLTLGDRQEITGRSLTQRDDGTGLDFCVDCLADLPRGVEALAHVCGETVAEVAPVAVAGPTGPLPALYVPGESDPRPAERAGPHPEPTGWLVATLADIDARLAAAREHGCDPSWCTAYRWDGAHVGTCRVARESERRRAEDTP